MLGYSVFFTSLPLKLSYGKQNMDRKTWYCFTYWGKVAKMSEGFYCCSGLTYLHTFSGRCIIHRDVKSSNILLDHSMNAKVTDFGFSKYAPQEGDSGASLEVRGTAGYLDPEWVHIFHSYISWFGIQFLKVPSININLINQNFFVPFHTSESEFIQVLLDTTSFCKKWCL